MKQLQKVYVPQFSAPSVNSAGVSRLILNLTTACITYSMLSAGYLSIKITKHLLVFRLEGGGACTVMKSKFLPHFNDIEDLI